MTPEEHPIWQLAYDSFIEGSTWTIAYSQGPPENLKNAARRYADNYLDTYRRSFSIRTHYTTAARVLSDTEPGHTDG